MKKRTNGLSRRHFLQASASTGSAFLIGFRLSAVGRTAEAAEAAAAEAGQNVNAWLQIAPDDTVTILLSKAEMGQGVYTGLPMIVADELECDWQKVAVEMSPPGEEYRNPGEPTMITGGSSSTAANFAKLRQVGAAAREMLVAAAAKKWGVKPSDCKSSEGIVTGPGGKSASYGTLAADAAKLPVPAKPALKADSELKLIGKSTPRKDTPLKVRGAAQYAIDVRLPGMIYAAVRTSPVFGGDIANFDEISKPPAGTLSVHRVPGGIAVLADSWWVARTALDALKPRWTKTDHDQQSSEGISSLFQLGMAGNGVDATKIGDVEAALKSCATRVEADFEMPFQAHATMEPMSCVADVRADGVDVWVGSQAQELHQQAAARTSGLPPEKVKLHSTFLGGGFGRRFESDFVIQAVTLSKAAGKPVKVLWTREEDMQHDFYRPAYLCKLTGGLDANKNPTAWMNRVVCPSIMTRVMPIAVKAGLDDVSVEGAKEIPYAIPNIHVDYVMVNTHVPVGFWRSVGSSANAFAIESFVDQMAFSGGVDPLEFRRKMLAKQPLFLETLNLAAEKAGWKEKLEARRGRGIAIFKSFDTIVAEVVEASVANDGKVSVHKVTCAVHCGRAANPQQVEAQMMSSVIFALSSALKGQITIKDGAVEQSGWSDFELIRMPEAPAVEVHIVPSSAPPTGTGEPGVPPLAPALANAIFAATGKRLRKIPVDEDLLKKG